MSTEPAEARYRESGDNRMLLSGLWRAHRLQCYWCAEPKEFRDLQVDHILQQTASDQQRDRLAAELGQPLPYDVHDAYNLAPICGACNLDKRAIDFTTTPRILTELHTARRVRPDVIKHVRLLIRSGDLSELLLKWQNLDLRSAERREEFAEIAPLVVERIAAVDPALVHYPLRRRLQVTGWGRFDDPVTVEIDVSDAGRRALQAFAEFGSPTEAWLNALWSEFGSEFEDLVTAASREVEQAADQHADIVTRVGMANYSLTPQDLLLRVYDVQVDLDDEQISMIMEGEVEVRVSGSGVMPTHHGGGLDEFLVDAESVASFSAELRADPTQPRAAESTWAGDFETGTPMVELLQP